MAEKRTCMKCGRPVGMLSAGRCRPYVVELTTEGVGPVCQHKSSCNLARMQNRKG